MAMLCKQDWWSLWSDPTELVRVPAQQTYLDKVPVELHTLYILSTRIVTRLSRVCAFLVHVKVILSVKSMSSERKPITPNPPRWKPNPDPASIVIPGLDTEASTTDQIEQIEQLITIKLQVRLWLVPKFLAENPGWRFFGSEYRWELFQNPQCVGEQAPSCCEKICCWHGASSGGCKGASFAHILRRDYACW